MEYIIVLEAVSKCQLAYAAPPKHLKHHLSMVVCPVFGVNNIVCSNLTDMLGAYSPFIGRYSVSTSIGPYPNRTNNAFVGGVSA